MIFMRMKKTRLRRKRGTISFSQFAPN
uniref:Uncharacterized protein n=1 Tax=Timema douglasi TaxID=61478 RepID=A0A7R8ZIB0_TIMDO|nr:unnamed protein product [Timema douglasi]